MPDKELMDKVLPLVGDYKVPTIEELVYDAVEAQRDADLVILKRDYLPKERSKVLVEALQQISDMGHLPIREVEAKWGLVVAGSRPANIADKALAQLKETTNENIQMAQAMREKP